MSKPSLADTLRLYFITNYKTTMAGLATGLGGIALLLSAFPWSPDSLQKCFEAIVAIGSGIGLILSKDASTALDKPDALPPDEADNVARPIQ